MPLLTPARAARSKRRQRDAPAAAIRRVSPDTSDAEDCVYPDYPTDPFIGLNPKNDDGTIDHFMSLRKCSALIAACYHGTTTDLVIYLLHMQLLCA